MYSSNLHIMTSSYYDHFGFHNIQEIVDIRLIFEIICMFYFIFNFILIPNDEKRGNQQQQ